MVKEVPLGPSMDSNVDKPWVNIGHLLDQCERVTRQANKVNTYIKIHRLQDFDSEDVDNQEIHTLISNWAIRIAYSAVFVR